jgi:hypothetical protein
MTDIQLLYHSGMGLGGGSGKRESITEKELGYTEQVMPYGYFFAHLWHEAP